MRTLSEEIWSNLRPSHSSAEIWVAQAAQLHPVIVPGFSSCKFRHLVVYARGVCDSRGASLAGPVCPKPACKNFVGHPSDHH